MRRTLERRLRYFLTSNYRDRASARRTIRELEELGQIALIGGMLRDIALFGNAGFHSDLDLVIAPFDPDAFERKMASKGATINKFGGYALPFEKWQVDIWPLKKTWAHTAGHVEVNSFSDLKNVTFFGCDAIIYDISNKHLHANEEYFKNLNDRILEINLLPNPNPQGNAIRAFRYSMLKGFRWGPKLTRFIAQAIEASGWDGLSKVEQKSFNTTYLNMINRQEIESNLREYISQELTTTFNPKLFSRFDQMNLPYL